MRPVGLEDVLGRERYGVERDAIRRRVIEHKRARRVALGDRLTILFEDRATVWYQTQEMLWVEHITDLDAIRAELAVYNQLLPGPRELSTTLLIEIEDQARIREELERLIGIDEHLELLAGGARVAGVFEPGRQRADKLSAVQYVRFPLSAAAVAALGEGAPIVLRTTHPSYAAETTLPEPVRAALALDLTDAAAADRALRRVRDGV
ncbi:MAG TPA: DUF3501 family protein [Candidatus Binatia bacterium]|nr:DUF3501 family protein [Candidatus Binatia bacterium]